MLKKLFIAAAFIILLNSYTFADHGPDLQEGLWEISKTINMTGTSVDIPSMTHTQCLTKDDIVPQSSEPGRECTLTKTKVKNNTVTWTMKCSGLGQEMIGVGEVTYYGNIFKGTVRMSIPGTEIEMISNINGHRVGDCR